MSRSTSFLLSGRILATTRTPDILRCGTAMAKNGGCKVKVFLSDKIKSKRLSKNSKNSLSGEQPLKSAQALAYYWVV